jgi:hypothetical protein
VQRAQCTPLGLKTALQRLYLATQRVAVLAARGELLPGALESHRKPLIRTVSQRNLHLALGGNSSRGSRLPLRRGFPGRDVFQLHHHRWR